MNAMLIVEPRKHPLLKTVIHNFDKNMPTNWDLYVVHGKSFQEHAKEAVKDINRTVKLIQLQTDNLTADEYNHLFKKISFWNKIKAENILVFQTDSALCSKSNFNIHDFMKYDYIGCAAENNHGNKFGNHNWSKTYPHSFFYGIGGLSFRKNSFQKKCIRENKVPPHFAEDVFYSNCVHKYTKPENAKKIQQFCSQTNFTKKSFGSHKTKDIKSKKFYKYCPEAKTIL
jgi:hypothetical protein